MLSEAPGRFLEGASSALLLAATNSPLGSCAFLGSVVSCAIFPTLGYSAHSPLPSSCPSLQAGEDLGSGSTISWCPAPGFYCPWLFSQSLDPIQFPHISLVTAEPTLSANESRSVPAFSPGSRCDAIALYSCHRTLSPTCLGCDAAGGPARCSGAVPVGFQEEVTRSS